MQSLSKYKWFGLLGIVVTLVFVIGFERPPGAQAFTSITPPYFFVTGAAPAPAGQYLTGFSPSGLEHPTGIAFAEGQIFVADFDGGNLDVFPLSGGNPTASYSISSWCTGPVGLTRVGGTSAGGGSLYIACNTFAAVAIHEIGFDGSDLRRVTGVNTIGTNVFDLTTTEPAAGDLLVASSGITAGAGAIFRVDPSTGGVTTCATGALNRPDGIVVDYQTNIMYASNIGNDTIAKIPAQSLLPGGVCGGAAKLFATGFPANAGIDGSAIGLAGTPCQDTLFVNANDGNLYAVTISTGLVQSPPIATGGSRGDLVKVSDDGYLFATQGRHVVKIGPPCFKPAGGSITICKQTDPAAGTQGFAFSEAPSSLLFTLHENDCYTTPTPNSPYTFTELGPPTGPAGWTLTNISCIVAGGGVANVVFNPGGLTGFSPGVTGVTISPLQGQHVTCAFTNTTSATFTANKVYRPSGPTASVAVSVSCSSGTPAPGSGLASPPSPFTTTITGFNTSGTTCTAKEIVPTGYTQTTDCIGVPITVGGTASCTMTNTLTCAGWGHLDISTGTDGIGSPDPQWILTSVPANSGLGPPPFGILRATALTLDWVPPPPPSNWIHPGNTAGSKKQRQGNYVYERTFSPPTGATGLSFNYVFAADNDVKIDLYRNSALDVNIPPELTAGAATNFTALHQTQPPTFVVPVPGPSVYTLRATVVNLPDGFGGPTFEGFLLVGTVTCTGSAVGGLVALSVADSGSGPRWMALAASLGGASALLAAGLWYGRRRWLR